MIVSIGKIDSGDPDLPGKEAKKRKSRVQGGASSGLVRRVDLASSSETSKRVEHAGAHETHESQQ